MSNQCQCKGCRHIEAKVKVNGGCQHDNYWTGIYGTCMACRAEKAESLNKILRDGLEKIAQPTAGIYNPIAIAKQALAEVEKIK